MGKKVTLQEIARIAKVSPATISRIASDWTKAPKLADVLLVSKIHKLLDRFARRYCAVIQYFRVAYH